MRFFNVTGEKEPSHLPWAESQTLPLWHVYSSILRRHNVASQNEPRNSYLGSPPKRRTRTFRTHELVCRTIEGENLQIPTTWITCSMLVTNVSHWNSGSWDTAWVCSTLTGLKGLDVVLKSSASELTYVFIFHKVFNIALQRRFCGKKGTLPERMCHQSTLDKDTPPPVGTLKKSNELEKNFSRNLLLRF